jgi:hypothetical protein
MIQAPASADRQTVLPDGTALGDIRYTLRTDAGECRAGNAHNRRGIDAVDRVLAFLSSQG